MHTHVTGNSIEVTTSWSQLGESLAVAAIVFLPFLLAGSMIGIVMGAVVGIAVFLAHRAFINA